MTTLSPECRLVFSTAQSAPDREELAGIAGDVRDWQRVMLLAERERATANLYRALGPTGRTALPDEVLERLHRSAVVMEFRMAHLEQRLRATLARLAADNVPVVLLKGAAFGASVYGGFDERPMLDVDVLVSPDDVARAQIAVLDSGWNETTDPVVRRLLEGHHHLPGFVDSQGTGLRLELHTALTSAPDRFQLLTDEYLASVRPAGGDYATATVASAPCLLLHACMHFAWSHTMRFGAWRTFRDANELISRSLIDWDAFVELAKRTHTASVCYWTLRLGRRLSGVAVPDSALASLAPPGQEWVRRGLESHFVSEIAIGEMPLSPSVTLAHALWRMAIRPGWSGLGGRGPLSPDSHWDQELRGVRPDSPTNRIVRHLTALGDWRAFAWRTMMGRSRRVRR